MLRSRPPGRRGPPLKVLLLDIEGTTTPVSFVTDVLFPYARERVLEFLRRRGDEPGVRDDLRRLEEERAADAAAGRAVPPAGGLETAAEYLRQLIDADRKSTALKSIQGRIWEEGFRAGELRGLVYPDVAPAMRAWREAGGDIAIFSSGSVLAQKLLFGTTADGDLNALVSAHFDTTTGGKRDPDSYVRIAGALQARPEEILFVSDVVAELDAARAARLATALCVREGRGPQRGPHPVVTGLAAVVDANLR